MLIDAWAALNSVVPWRRECVAFQWALQFHFGGDGWRMNEQPTGALTH